MEDLKQKTQVLSELVKLIPAIFGQGIDFTIIQFKSKKNLVYDVEFMEKPQEFPKSIVVKHFQTSNALREYNILSKLSNQDIFIPEILFFKEPILALEKIEGWNLSDFIAENLGNIDSLDELDRYTYDRLIFAVKKLADWLAQLHKQNILEWRALKEVIVLNKGDTRLRDFVISSLNDEIYGLDFEDSYEGNYLDDVAWICCALLDTDPGLFQMVEPKHKTELINVFLREYYKNNTNFPFNFDYFTEKLVEYLNIVIERRSLSYGSISKEAILAKISKNF
jgi:tRNA A-37 threonylcarbamoyl transferase component Bud32